MTWVRLDDRFRNHPKILRAIADAGPEAGWWWTCALAWSSDYATDGFVPETAFRSVAPGVEAKKMCDRAVAALLEAGLLERADGGVRLHDYTDWQPSADEVKARRRATAERVTKWREQKKKRESNDERNAVTPIDEIQSRPRGRLDDQAVSFQKKSSVDTSQVRDSTQDSIAGNYVGNALLTPPPSPSPSPSHLTSFGSTPHSPPNPVRGLGQSEIPTPESRTQPVARPLDAGVSALEFPFWSAAYAEAVAEVTGEPWAMPADVREHAALTAVVRARCPDRSRIVAFLRECVPNFVRDPAVAANPGVWFGFAPRGLERWFNSAAGRALPAKARASPSRDVQPAPAGGPAWKAGGGSERDGKPDERRVKW